MVSDAVPATPPAAPAPSEVLGIERDGHVVVLTLRRPHVRNAVDGALATAIEAAVDDIEADDEVRCGVVTGAGPAFCAGADLKEIAAGRPDAMVTARGGFAGLTRRERRKPLIAAVEGAAVAGGTEIVLSCDLVVASITATFGLPEVRRGLLAAAGGLHRLARTLPRNVALAMALTGRPIPAADAERHGLVNVLCPSGDALARARDLAHEVAANAPLSVYASRAVLLDSLTSTEDAAWEATHRAAASLRGTTDFLEGPRAFVEKRTPRWTGH